MILSFYQFVVSNQVIQFEVHQLYLNYFNSFLAQLLIFHFIPH